MTHHASQGNGNKTALVSISECHETWQTLFLIVAVGNQSPLTQSYYLQCRGLHQLLRSLR